MTDEEKKQLEEIKADLLSQPWSDDGTDEEWDEETLKDWEEKMNEPVGCRILTEDEFEELRKQGRI